MFTNKRGERKGWVVSGAHHVKKTTLSVGKVTRTMFETSLGVVTKESTNGSRELLKGTELNEKGVND